MFVATPYMDEADRCNEIAFMTQGRIILRDTPAGMKRRVPGRVIEVALTNYREAMPIVRAHAVRQERRGLWRALRVLVAPRRGVRRRRGVSAATLSTAAGFTVEHMRPAPTDLEMAFATLIPTADEPLARADDDILAVAE